MNRPSPAWKRHRSPILRFVHKHSLSLTAIAFLIAWIVLYRNSDPSTHMGAFYGNAIADWSGSVVIILGTKWLIEIGSAESRVYHGHIKNPFLKFLACHSLLLFLITTGIAWAIVYARMDANSKWGQVVGNIVSEWLQMAGLVFLTKKLIERGSKESK
ncbi:MAG: hypothetical protein JWO95_559 [Verrucomicrobiales bacterium]|nr:hypothetical protein [Verrucomicrobiales bacterium]